MILYHGHQYRVVTAVRKIMYHGTASGDNDTILKRILKEGLNPQPKKRVFDLSAEELAKTHGINWDNRDVETYGGVYFTDAAGTAYNYAHGAVRSFGGDAVMIAAQIETRSPATRVDEDFLMGGSDFFLGEYERVQGIDAIVRKNKIVNILERVWQNDIDWDIVANHYVADKILSRWKVPKQRLQQIRPLLARALMLQTQYWLAKKVQDGLVGDESKWTSVYQGDLAPMALRKQYRAAAEQVLQKLREATEPKAGVHEENRIRIMEPVGYGGANRILAVVRLHEEDRHRGQPYSVVATVLYNRDGFAVAKIRDMTTRMLDQYQLWTEKGKILYDVPDPKYRQDSVKTAEAPAETYGAMVYHGSDHDLTGFKAMWPQYEGGIGGGVYVDFDRNVAAQYGHNVYQARLLLHANEIFWLDPNVIPGLEGYSLLSGEQVAPFWFECGGEYYVVSNGMFQDHMVPEDDQDDQDDAMSLDDLGDQIDLEDIGEVVERHGYKAVWLEGIRPMSELLVFDPRDLEFVGLADERTGK